jgi:hypothetical protein
MLHWNVCSSCSPHDRGPGSINCEVLYRQPPTRLPSVAHTATPSAFHENELP